MNAHYYLFCMYMYASMAKGMIPDSNSWKFFKKSKVIKLFLPDGQRGKNYDPIYDFYEEVTE